MDGLDSLYHQPQWIILEQILNIVSLHLYIFQYVSLKVRALGGKDGISS